MILKGKVPYKTAWKNRHDWMGSLRSGGYSQTTKRLANEEYTAFCCLGVAEETVGPKFGITRHHSGAYTIGLDSVFYNYEDRVQKSTLHNNLRDGMGLTDDHISLLMSLNDDVKASFDQIASVVSYLEYHCSDGIFSSDGTRLGITYQQVDAFREAIANVDIPVN